jgi:hypothetical protein
MSKMFTGISPAYRGDAEALVKQCGKGNAPILRKLVANLWNHYGPLPLGEASAGQSEKATLFGAALKRALCAQNAFRSSVRNLHLSALRRAEAAQAAELTVVAAALLSSVASCPTQFRVLSDRANRCWNPEEEGFLEFLAREKGRVSLVYGNSPMEHLYAECASAIARRILPSEFKKPFKGVNQHYSALFTRLISRDFLEAEKLDWQLYHCFHAGLKAHEVARAAHYANDSAKFGVDKVVLQLLFSRFFRNAEKARKADKDALKREAELFFFHEEKLWLTYPQGVEAFAALMKKELPMLSVPCTPEVILESLLQQRLTNYRKDRPMRVFRFPEPERAPVTAVDIAEPLLLLPNGSELAREYLEMLAETGAASLPAYCRPAKSVGKPSFYRMESVPVKAKPETDAHAKEPAKAAAAPAAASVTPAPETIRDRLLKMVRLFSRKAGSGDGSIIERHEDEKALKAEENLRCARAHGFPRDKTLLFTDQAEFLLYPLEGEDASKSEARLIRMDGSARSANIIGPADPDVLFETEAEEEVTQLDPRKRTRKETFMDLFDASRPRVRTKRFTLENLPRAQTRDEAYAILQALEKAMDEVNSRISVITAEEDLEYQRQRYAGVYKKPEHAKAKPEPLPKGAEEMDAAVRALMTGPDDAADAPGGSEAAATKEASSSSSSSLPSDAGCAESAGSPADGKAESSSAAPSKDGAQKADNKAKADAGASKSASLNAAQSTPTKPEAKEPKVTKAAPLTGSGKAGKGRKDASKAAAQKAPAAEASDAASAKEGKAAAEVSASAPQDAPKTASVHRTPDADTAAPQVRPAKARKDAKGMKEGKERSPNNAGQSNHALKAAPANEQQGHAAPMKENANAPQAAQARSRDTAGAAACSASSEKSQSASEMHSPGGDETRTAGLPHPEKVTCRPSLFRESADDDPERSPTPEPGAPLTPEPEANKN